MKGIQSALLGLALFAGAAGALAQSEQFIPVLSYRVGPYAAGGSGYYGGAIDYFTLVNMTGGINGVKLSWEECETEYNASKGVECYERLKKKNGATQHLQAKVKRRSSFPCASINGFRRFRPKARALHFEPLFFTASQLTAKRTSTVT